MVRWGKGAFVAFVNGNLVKVVRFHVHRPEEKR